MFGFLSSFYILGNTQVAVKAKNLIKTPNTLKVRALIVMKTVNLK